MPEVIIHDDESFERALKRFKKKCEKAGILSDLRKHRHLVIRDTGSQRRAGSWLGAEQSWTVSHKATSIHAVVHGHGYAWFPEDWIVGELARGALVPLPLREQVLQACALLRERRLRGLDAGLEVGRHRAALPFHDHVRALAQER